MTLDPDVVLTAPQLDRIRSLAQRRNMSVASLRDQLLDSVLNAEENPPLPPIDVLIITATSTEFDELLAVARTDYGMKATKRRGADQTYHYLGEVMGDQVAVVKLRAMGSFTAGGSAFSCLGAALQTFATTFIVVGTAFGIDETTQPVGDVLVSSSLRLYESVDVHDHPTPPGGYLYNYDRYPAIPASERWLKRVRVVAPESEEMLEGHSVHFGQLLAGTAHISSRQFRDELIARCPDGSDEIVGGEMEAAGVAAWCSHRGSDWIVLKGISDHATFESRERIKTTRGIAARNAARLALAVLKTPPDVG